MENEGRQGTLLSHTTKRIKDTLVATSLAVKCESTCRAVFPYFSFYVISYFHIFFKPLFSHLQHHQKYVHFLQADLRLASFRVLLECLYVLAHFFAPLLPTASTEILRRLGTPSQPIVSLNCDFNNLKAGTPVRREKENRLKDNPVDNFMISATFHWSAKRYHCPKMPPLLLLYHYIRSSTAFHYSPNS